MKLQLWVILILVIYLVNTFEVGSDNGDSSRVGCVIKQNIDSWLNLAHAALPPVIITVNSAVNYNS